MQNKRHVTIIGAGMGGSLLSIYLARRNFNVEVYESRDDIKNLPTVSDKSINQSLTIRGITALKEVNLWETVKKFSLEEKGRVIHQKNGKLLYEAYGEKQGFAEWSINRNDLNKILLREMRKFPNIKVHFNAQCTGIDLEKRIVKLKDLHTGIVSNKKTDFVVGADGVHSNVRKTLEEKNHTRTNLEYLDWGYKNMYIPAPKKGKLPFQPHAFHCWPKKKAGMVGFPNSKGFFTCTLTLPLVGENSFATLTSKKALLQYFKQYFPDLLPFIPPLAREFLKKKVATVTTLKTSTWYYKDFLILLGDASHAVTIFYGQGINAAFEDCRVLSECIDRYAPDYEKAFASFQSLRKPNTDVLADLCKRRFLELKDKYASPFFIGRSTIETFLEQIWPNAFQTLYTQIVFTQLPYSQALRRYQKQRLIARFLGLDIVEFILGFYLLSKNYLAQK